MNNCHSFFLFTLRPYIWQTERWLKSYVFKDITVCVKTIFYKSDKDLDMSSPWMIYALTRWDLPKAVETIIGTVYSQNRRPGVRLRYSSITL